MSSRSVELEVVHYNKPAMVHASKELLHNFAQYSGVEGADTWGTALVLVAGIIENQASEICLWRAQGIRMTFTGFQRPIPTIKDERLVYTARPPRFVIEEPNDDLLPSKRTHVERVTNAIVREMSDVYHLQVNQDPLTLVFPKEEYAKRIELFNAALLM